MDSCAQANAHVTMNKVECTRAPLTSKRSMTKETTKASANLKLSNWNKNLGHTPAKNYYSEIIGIWTQLVPSWSMSRSFPLGHKQANDSCFNTYKWEQRELAHELICEWALRLRHIVQLSVRCYTIHTCSCLRSDSNICSVLTNGPNFFIRNVAKQ